MVLITKRLRLRMRSGTKNDKKFDKLFGQYWEILGNIGKKLENIGKILKNIGKIGKILGNIGEKIWEILLNIGVRQISQGLDWHKTSQLQSMGFLEFFHVVKLLYFISRILYAIEDLTASNYTSCPYLQHVLFSGLTPSPERNVSDESLTLYLVFLSCRTFFSLGYDFQNTLLY